MSYSDDKGKYQKAYDFLFNKLVPPSGAAMNNLGEALRLVSKVYYRKNNDGDTYDDCIEMGMVPDFSKNQYPFNGEYNPLGRELDHLLSSNMYDTAINLVLIHIMLSLSSESNIYNPKTNRLVPLDTEKGRNVLKELDLNSVFINYCGKNEEWLPETLRKDGVKISKQLSDQTKKELNCDTIQEIYREKKVGYNKTPVKISLSKDNSILSKKFSKIKSEHKRSVKAEQKKRRELKKQRDLREKKNMSKKVKNYNITKQFHEKLRDLNTKKRVDFLKNMLKSRANKCSIVKMLLTTLVEYKEKKSTTKPQRENKNMVVEKLTKGLNEAGIAVLKSLSYHDPKDSLYSYHVNVDVDELDEKLDNLLVEIYGSSEAVDVLYNRCCRY
jgi:hypothetical protein